MPDNGNTDPWLQGVVGPAVEIIQSDAEAIRVAAGPGTGKTFALMRRVARLLAQGADPSRLLVVTFTRTAARDLVDSLRALGVDGATEVKAGTLHSYCFSVLSREAVLEATGRVPRPLQNHERRAMQADLQHQHGFGIRESNELLSAFDAAWARLQSDEPGWPQDPREDDFHRALMDWLRFHRGMLIGELVPQMRSYVRNNPHAPPRTAFDHVLVDEYQDLNRADQDLIELLAENGQLLVIGDEDQSIYTQLRFAQPEGIREFGRDIGDLADIPLAACRRCPTSVVEAANHLIARNTDREPRTLEPFEGNPKGVFQIVQWPSFEAEVEGLANTITTAIAAGEVDPGQILVLTPRRVLGYAIRDELRAREIAAHSYFSEEALDETAAQERYTLLNLLAQGRDRVALRTWLGFDHNRTLAAASYSRLQARCEETGEEPIAALNRLSEGDLKLRYSDHLIQRYQALQQELEQLQDLRGQGLVDALFPADVEEFEQVRALACEAVEEKGDDLAALPLFEDLRTRITQPELPEEGDFIRVMSLHKSKGLTADMVIVAGAVEGWIPTVESGAPEEEAVVEEQRRLFYVAITRPRQRLILSTFVSMRLDMAHRMRVRIGRRTASRASCIASRFLGELGPNMPRAVRGDPSSPLPGAPARD